LFSCVDSNGTSACREFHTRYDQVGRLTRAITAAQVNQNASSSTTTDYSFDPFGNMLSHLRTAGAAVPSWYDWSGRTYEGNRITSHGYVHDANGNTLRLIDSGGVTSGALWDDRGRMRVLVGGDPYTAAGVPSENYLFDASGIRFARQDKRGFPTITLRDLSGQALAEYTKKSGDTFPKLDRDLIYGAGKLLVERVVTGVLPHATGSDPLRTSTNYNFSLDAGTTSSSYDVDIQTSAGYQNYLTGIQLGSGNSFTIPESALQSQQVNFVRIRGANPQITPYSQPVSVIYDPNITSSATNNVRALAISRSGTSVLVRWELAGTTTKKFRVYFKNADGSATYLLTPLGLSSGSRTYTLTDQTLSQVCGDFYVTIVLTEAPLTESPPSPFGRLGSSQAGIQGPLDPCGGGTGSNPISYAFANSYHHRDHLGSLRAETDEAGNRTVKRDYYAFGIEQQGYAASSEAATARQFTSAEKGFFNGLDSMMARFNSGNAGRFLSPDPILGNAMNPQSWNRYSFVLNNPLSYTDPSGKLPIPVFNNGPNRGSADDVGGAGEHRSMESWRGRITFHNVDAYFAMRAWQKAEAARRRTADFCQRNPHRCGHRSDPLPTLPPVPVPPPDEQSALAGSSADSGKKEEPEPSPLVLSPNPPPGPPPIPVPGAPEGTTWKWNANPQNPRGGTWGPDTPIPRQSQPSASWDPIDNHWDVDPGVRGAPRTRYSSLGEPLTKDQAHSWIGRLEVWLTGAGSCASKLISVIMVPNPCAVGATPCEPLHAEN
jgi:RHS repeat-associated protein